MYKHSYNSDERHHFKIAIIEKQVKDTHDLYDDEEQ